MFTRSARRSGFTLPEVLVTVAIVAILAAVVVPAVTQQISKGDQGQFQGSIGGVQTAITTYVTDVRRYPAAVSQLTNQVAAGDSTAVPEGELTTAEAARWKGPYLQFDLAAAGTFDVGYGIEAVDTLGLDGSFITLKFDTDSIVANRVDSIVDNADGNAAGNFRWTPNNAAALDSTWYRLLTAR
jgi:prepilin-type N-terminal cleavage/methylation domain-containing protein